MSSLETAVLDEHDVFLSDEETVETPADNWPGKSLAATAVRHAQAFNGMDEYRAAQPGKLDKASEDRLFERAREGDREIMGLICRNYYPLVYFLAERYGKTPEMIEELSQIGLMVIPKAVQRYKREKNVDFSAYLSQKICYKYIDCLRDESAQLGVSRMDYQRVKKLEEIEDIDERKRALHELLTHPDPNKRVPRAADMVNAEEGIMTGFRHASLDDPSFTWNSIDMNQNVFNEVARRLEIEELESHVSQLPRQQRQVLTHYYGLFGETPLTLKEIGEVVLGGRSESRASQLHSKGMANLKRLRRGEELNLKNRLKSIEMQPASVNDSLFVARVKGALDKVKGVELSEAEIATVLSHYPGWQYLTAKVGKGKYKILRRVLEDIPDKASAILETNETSRRAVGLKDNALIILVKEVQGSDLQQVIDIESALNAQPQFENTGLFNNLTEMELSAVKDAWMPSGFLSCKLGISESTLRTHAFNGRKKLNAAVRKKLDRADVIVLGVREGMIPLDDVPAGRTFCLSGQESRLLKNYYNVSYKACATEMGISVSTVRSHWHNIYQKIDALTQEQAILMAVKDGLINVGEI